jgi:protein phosphatase
LTRERNEDCAAARPERGIFAVADGMGGHVGGDVASRVAVEAALEALEASPVLDLDSLAHAIRRANRAVLEEASRRRLWGMGTTLTLACVAPGAVRIAHVGDSRAYLLQARRVTRLTTDQTLVEQLVQQGILPRARAHRHPERHVLAQALGMESEIRPELLQTELPGGARLLLSTDGLHDQVGEPELAELASAPDLAACADALIRAANRSGGLDNATVLLVESG